VANTKAHQKYRNAAGIVVPSVTTIIGTNLGWNKNVLIAWAKKTALAGLDPDAVKQEAADTGTLAHGMIEEYITSHVPHLTPTTIDRRMYTPEQLEKATNGFNAFIKWSESVSLDFSSADIRSEMGIVSEMYSYGGTIDFIAPLSGKLCLIDFKTSNGVYADHIIQLSAYQMAFYEKTGIYLPAHLLRISKTGEEFHHHYFENLDYPFEVFTLLCKIHALKSGVEGMVLT